MSAVAIRPLAVRARRLVSCLLRFAAATLGPLLAGLFAMQLASPARAWDVKCTVSVGGPDCKDPFERVRTEWRDDIRAEHGTLLKLSIGHSGLPAALLQPFELHVYAADSTVVAPDSATTYTSVNPVLAPVRRKATRTVYLQGMANLPDFSYTLADWSSGAEQCLPDPANADPFDCHNYETHIGWLNTNHFLPQSRRWYEHQHQIALEIAAKCKAAYDATPQVHRPRFQTYFLACEKLALTVEGVGHHYLQDSWASGHMWERWGGTEPADFAGRRGVGFAVGAFTGLIHGAKAMLDTTPGFAALAPWDDPLSAPHPDVRYNDGGVLWPAVGDQFLDELIASAGDVYAIQRRSLFGCAVDGLRAVYGATAMQHGPMGAADVLEIDTARSVTNDSCWAQRATDDAMGTGMGVHLGAIPDAEPLLLGAQMTIIAGLGTALPILAGHPELLMPPDDLVLFQTAASASATLAWATKLLPHAPEDTTIASGGFPPLALVLRNSAYARGDAAAHVAPTSYADPFPPWRVKESDPVLARRSVPLNLTFADANAADRCTELGESDLQQLIDAVSDARANGQPQEVVDARCGRCVQLLAPHLRFGLPGNFDSNREAYCAFVAPGASAFKYTGESGPFGGQPTDFQSLLDAASLTCKCTEVAISLVPGSTTLNLNQTRQFLATITGTPNTAVTWMATGGTISAAGLYTATTFGSFTVKATSVADPNKFATATVSVVPTGGVVISPAKAAVGFGRSQQFSLVGGAPPITWSATGGAVSQTGLYTGGNVMGEYNVSASNLSGGASATVIVDPYIGNYKGTWQRHVPSALSGSNAQFSIGRFLVARAECGFGSLCYGTSQVDLGTVNIGQCWLFPAAFGSQTVTGYCDATATSGGGTLVGTVTGSAYTWTLQRMFQGSLVESWSFSLSRL